MNYCQGMNYMASFLYQLCDYKEEDAFYLMLSIFQKTDFTIIFFNDLYCLKQYFYTFDRILSIYQPEVSSFFKVYIFFHYKDEWHKF